MVELISVFWALLAMKLFHVTEARSRRKLKELEEIQFDVGDLIQMQDGMTLWTLNENEFFYMAPLNNYYATVRKGNKEWPFWKKKMGYMLRKPLPFAETLGPILSERLEGRKLPISTSCSIAQWSNYFVLGYTNTGRFSTKVDDSCPIKRDLTRLRMSDIKDTNFYLSDKRGSMYFVNNIRLSDDPGSYWYELPSEQPQSFTSKGDQVWSEILPQNRLLPTYDQNTRRGSFSSSQSGKSSSASSSTRSSSTSSSRSSGGIFPRGFFSSWFKNRNRARNSW